MIAVAIATVVAFDYHIFGLNPIAEMSPRFSPYFIARIIVAFLVSILLLFIIGFDATAIAELNSHGGGGLCWVLVWATLALVFLSIHLIAADPDLFSQLAREDSWFESASAFFLAAACFTMCWAIGVELTKSERYWPAIAGLALFAVAFAIIALEEISWGQRIFGFETPESIRGLNRQHEFNFHNIRTDLTENIYYSFAFVVLVLIPIVSAANSELLGHHLNRLIQVPLPVVLIGILSTPFSYEMWNIIWMQVAFFLGLLLLLQFICFSLTRRDVLVGLAAGFCFAATAGANVVTFLFGSGMIRRWDDTEFKELIIAVGLFALSTAILSNVQDRRR